jgi:hypothetical protein
MADPTLPRYDTDIILRKASFDTVSAVGGIFKGVKNEQWVGVCHRVR